MGINYGTEYALFRADLARKHTLYQKLGMTKEQIQALDEFDWTEFRSNLVFRKHNQSIEPIIADDMAPDKNPLFKKYLSSFSVSFEPEIQDRYPWIEEILDPVLYRCVMKLTPEDLDIWDAYVFQGLTQEEIASSRRIDRSAVRRSLARVRGILRSSRNVE